MTESVQPEKRDDLEAWQARVAGKRLEGTSPATEAEADILREALLRMLSGATEGHPSSDDRTFHDRIIAAAEQLNRPTRPSYWRPIALAASVVLAVGLFTVVSLRQEEGARSGPQRGSATEFPGAPAEVLATDPAATARDLQKQLADAGVKVAVLQSGQLWFVDGVLPSPLPPVVADVLKRFGVAPPPDGQLNLVVKPGTPSNGR